MGPTTDPPGHRVLAPAEVALPLRRFGVGCVTVACPSCGAENREVPLWAALPNPLDAALWGGVEASSWDRETGKDATDPCTEVENVRVSTS
jgi:hypothetical protein